MVGADADFAFTGALLLAQLIERLPPLIKARVLMALLGIVVLGLGMILMVILGGRYVRRLSRAKVSATKPNADEWFRKPLTPPADSSDDSA
jgi:hypothetical protein